MRVVHFNTFDAVGGAARAVSRLHRALVEDGIDSHLYVLHKTGTDHRTHRIVKSSWPTEARAEISAAAMKALLYTLRSDEPFSPDITMLCAATRALASAAAGASVVHLHWTRGLISTAQATRLAREGGRPIVWTMMDLAPVTGGCHYTRGCERYRQGCGRCPRIRSNRAFDLSSLGLARKKRFSSQAKLTIVACNRWTASHAESSAAFGRSRREVIPLPIDLDVFRPLPSLLAREVLGIAPDRRVIFAGSLGMSLERKGLRPLTSALQALPRVLRDGARDDLPLIVTAGPQEFAASAEVPLDTRHLGMLGDDRSLALAYSAADVFVSPSLEDAGPMMVNESLACGTPVVAFDVGTAADHVMPGRNGWLAPVGDSEALAQGIAKVLGAAGGDGLRENSRREAERSFDPKIIARRYRNLYEQMLSGAETE